MKPSLEKNIFIKGDLSWNEQMNTICHVVNPSEHTVLLLVYSTDGEFITFSIADVKGRTIEMQ